MNALTFHSAILGTYATPIDHAQSVMQKIYGYPILRDHQKEILSPILQGLDTLAVIPTGGGKSMCYVLPAMMSHGLSVVISPLIALIRDQVVQLRRMHIPAAAFDSMQTPMQKQQVVTALREGRIKILFISPERLAQPTFRQFLASFSLQLIAVDEAHCASEWGTDFRPEYRKLGQYFASLPDKLPRLALTATATPSVQKEIIHFLGLRSPQKIIKSPLRDNLKISSELLKHKKQIQNSIMRIIPKKNQDQGIIYTFSRKNTEMIAHYLQQSSRSAKAYHGGMNPRLRDEVQREFLEDQLNIVVATNAFGMGINKKNIRFVHHYGLPMSVESYIQQIGRAGRDGKEAKCKLFYHSYDYAFHKKRIHENYPPNERLRQFQKQYLCIYNSQLSSQKQAEQIHLELEDSIDLRCKAILQAEGFLSSKKSKQEWQDFLRIYSQRRREILRRLHVMKELSETKYQKDRMIRKYFCEDKN